MSYAGAYDSGMMGSEAGTPFQPRHVVVLAELGDEEKAKYIEFLLENDVKVVEDRKGVFTANVRVGARVPGGYRRHADRGGRYRQPGQQAGRTHR